MRFVIPVIFLLGGAFAVDAVVLGGTYFLATQRQLQHQGHVVGGEIQRIVSSVIPRF